MIIKVISKTTFDKFGNEFSRTFTNFFIEGMALILLRGLKALSALIPFKEAL